MKKPTDPESAVQDIKRKARTDCNLHDEFGIHSDLTPLDICSYN